MPAFDLLTSLSRDIVMDVISLTADLRQ